MQHIEQNGRRHRNARQHSRSRISTPKKTSNTISAISHGVWHSGIVCEVMTGETIAIGLGVYVVVETRVMVVSAIVSVSV